MLFAAIRLDLCELIQRDTKYDMGELANDMDGIKNWNKTNDMETFVKEILETLSDMGTLIKVCLETDREVDGVLS